MSSEMNLITRLKGPTPNFFKKVINIALSLSGVGTAVLTADATVPGFTIPTILQKVCQWLIVAGLAAAAVSKTTVNTASDVPYKAPNDQEQQNK
jgi:hypothetical protein